MQTLIKLPSTKQIGDNIKFHISENHILDGKVIGVKFTESQVFYAIETSYIGELEIQAALIHYTEDELNKIYDNYNLNNMEEYKQYKRKGLSEMKNYEQGENLTGVSISDADRTNGSPKVGDMIARNPKNHEDKWLVAEKYFNDNLELA